MFLSRGYRDLGVAFQTNPVSQASSLGEAKDSALLSGRDGYLLEPTEWPKGSQASCGVSREVSGLLSRPCGKRRASSRDDGGVSWLFSSCSASVGFLSRGAQGSSLVAPGKSGLHSSGEGVRSIAHESL